MKRFRRIIIILLAVTVAAAILTAILLPPVVEKYITEHCRELTGRRVDLGDLRFNLFTGKIRIDGLRIFETDDSTSFVALEKLEMKMRLLPLLQRRITVGHMAVTHPEIYIRQNRLDFNFDDITEHLRSLDPRRGQSSKWDVGIDNISIESGAMRYTDVELGISGGFEDFDISIPGLRLAENSDRGLKFNFADGGSILTEWLHESGGDEYELHVMLDNFRLAGLSPGVRRKLDVGSVDGSMSLDMNIRGDMRHPTDFSAKGSAGLSHLTVTDSGENKFLSLDTLYLKLNEGNIGKRRYDLGIFYASGFDIDIRTDKSGNSNIDFLFSRDSLRSDAGQRLDDEQTESRPELMLKIGRIDVRKGSVHISDRSHGENFDYNISAIAMICQNFSLDRRNRIMFKAQMQADGAAVVRWDGDMRSTDNHNILFSLSNIDLKDFAPWISRYTAYPVTGGTLSWHSQNIISDRMLNATNRIELHNADIGRRPRKAEPEVDIPLRSALYLLKDSRGNTAFELPVSGHIDESGFSYGKALLDELNAAVQRAVTAPFALLSDNGDNIDRIDFEWSQRDFTAGEYARMTRLAEMISKRPAMKVIFTQNIDYDKALRHEAAAALREDYYSSRHNGTLLPDSLASAYALITSSTSRRLAAYADSLLAARHADTVSQAEKLLTLYGQQAAERVARRMHERDSILFTYITRTSTLRYGESIALEPLTDSLLKAYSGTDRYTLRIDIDGETSQVAVDENLPGTDTLPQAEEAERMP